MTLEHVDVLVIGAGLSGIGAACQLRQKCPTKSVAILESRAAIGGTWDMFRYPGVRSDSDMFTLGYSFRPWQDPQAIADGKSIRDYVQQTAVEYGVDRLIRFHHQVRRADWSSSQARWAVEAHRSDTGETVRLTCDFLYACAGYYSYDQAYTPAIQGTDRFAGPIIHPLHWPAGLDYQGKRVAVIGSGATAVTLVPALAETAAQVIMVQRSPSYVLALPSRDRLADRLRRILPARVVYPFIRWKNVLLSTLLYQLSRQRPAQVRDFIRERTRRQLPSGYDVDTDFHPSYDPWDQRLCISPDGDLFRALRTGRASIITDGIDTFTETGLALVSGTKVRADVIIMATGLSLVAIGGIQLSVDGQPVALPGTVAYKGMMLSGVPNFALALGYTNASWTLKCDLVSNYVCRLINFLDARDYQYCTPVPPDGDQAGEPLLDLKSGYVLRGLAALPQQGRSAPWRLHQNYLRDRWALRRGSLEDRGIRFTRSFAGPGDH